ncbi:flagellar basal-body MS-ring/collar protein FliF [Neobacillus thermocopriae]|uniref:flagellar basal-body MS-ring/collar protein FliF n=1 Tax=Neobacillus thermocopriae TaxID=1215031 RepID=UPI002E1A3353|nr:flagellar basal-body MS-ring/collar protein FliF [Neobacillus thermocopriae]MED3623994.1 flagellar basal-body MS-ring/collar protein FliF [Neobacillus thermocopriae]MED3713811.1 flagellar basal-body MS-ring/collar protein FliF [Neobacillus thermocopriae]
MNRSWIDQIKQTKEKFQGYWNARSKKQKWFIIGSFIFILASLSTFIFFASRPHYVPLYNGQLSQREVGDIKAELDKQGFTDYKISENGTMLLVPQKEAADLVVSLASEGYPKDNRINYSIFSQNLNFGATDRQYDILEREALQNQVAEVIKNVDGIKNAEVILTLPEESVFIRSDEEEKATASVMVEVEPGIKLNNQQIRALYTLVSKSVPNLPLENITIMNQYSETLALDAGELDDQSLDKYSEQQKVKKNIERDIQQSLQQLLGTILGTEKVYVHTFVKMNFDKVKVQENLVKPTDENNNGIVISSEKSSKTSTESGGSIGGVVGTGETDVPGYTGESSSGDSNYEEMQERVNYEVNRIQNEIVKSPYAIEDITINVGVEPDPENPDQLPRATEESIRNIVANTVRTALGHPELSQNEIDQRITIFPHSFAKNETKQQASEENWIYLIAAIAGGMLAAGLLIWWLLRRRKQNQVEEEDVVEYAPFIPQPMKENEEEDYLVEQEMSVENQLRKLLEQRPEDFSKVIRTWLNEEEG